jgi:hypothetical protein
MAIRTIQAAACAAGLILLAACGGNATSPAAAGSPQGRPAGAAATQPATPGSLPSACAIVTTAAVGALVGGSVTRQPAPAAATLSGTSGCYYATASGGSIAILLDTRPGVGPGIIQGAESQGGKALTGVGDSAALSRQGDIVAVNAVKGGLMISVSVGGPPVSDAAIERFVNMLFSRA